MTELACPDCGKGPFTTTRGLGAHRASHKKTTCPDCNKEFSKTGIGPHRASVHNSRKPIAVDRPAIDPTVVLQHLEQILVEGAPDAAVRRVRAFFARLDRTVDDQLFVVAGATWGPHLTTRAMVGHVAASALEPVVVVQLKLAGDHAARQRWIDEAEETRQQQAQARSVA